MIRLSEFIERALVPESELYAMLCGEIVVFDRTNQIVYIPISTHAGAVLNPLGDFRTMLGHGLLWSRHVEVDCSSLEMMSVVAGYADELPYASTHEYEIYRLKVAA